MRCSWRTVTFRLRSWGCNPRIIAAMLLGMAMSFRKVGSYCSFAETLSVKINVVESFVILSSTPISFVGIFLGALLLLSDAPFTTPMSQQEMLRIGRIRWMWGQILYLFVTCLLYYVCVLFFTIALTSLKCPVFLSTQWSEAMTQLAIQQPVFAVRSFGLAFPYPEYINAVGPFEAVLLSLLFNSFYTFFIGLCTLTINLLSKQGLGWVFAVSMHIGGYIIYANLSWLYPAKLSLLCCAMPAFQFIASLGMPTIYCLLIFSYCIVTIIYICRRFAPEIEL